MKNKLSIKIAVIIVATFAISGQVEAMEISAADPRTGFRNKAEVSEPKIVVPTVLEVPLGGNTSSGILIYNNTDMKPIPSMIVGEESGKLLPMNISSLSDGNYRTFQNFDLTNDGSIGRGSITLEYAEPLRTNSIRLILAEFVALPLTVTIRAEVNGTSQIVLSSLTPTSELLTFPETTSKKWTIEFVYSQPLRIVEVEAFNLDRGYSYNAVRFLAEPGKDYQIFSHPEYWGLVDMGEAPNLRDDRGVVKTAPASFREYEGFVPKDSDADGVVDFLDNCVSIANPNQEDINQNGRGDVCDDFDRDGVVNSSDNCVNDPNRNQSNVDGDDLGDVCDPDESRLTEKYPFLVWGALGFVVLAFLGLLAYTVKTARLSKADLEQK